MINCIPSFDLLGLSISSFKHLLVIESSSSCHLDKGLSRLNLTNTYVSRRSGFSLGLVIRWTVWSSAVGCAYSLTLHLKGFEICCPTTFTTCMRSVNRIILIKSLRIFTPWPFRIVFFINYFPSFVVWHSSAVRTGLKFSEVWARWSFFFILFSWGIRWNIKIRLASWGKFVWVWNCLGRFLDLSCVYFSFCAVLFCWVVGFTFGSTPWFFLRRPRFSEDLRLIPNKTIIRLKNETCIIWTNLKRLLRFTRRGFFFMVAWCNCTFLLLIY